jgi:hypothetical protein
MTFKHLRPGKGQLAIDALRIEVLLTVFAGIMLEGKE